MDDPLGNFFSYKMRKVIEDQKYAETATKRGKKKQQKKIALIYFKANSHVKPLTYICQQGD